MNELPMARDDLTERARAIIAAYPEPRGALHPLVELVLSEASWGDASADWIAELTGIPVATVYGIAQSRHRPAGDVEEVAVCTGLSCRWMGAEAVCSRLERLSEVRVVEVECLGACSAAPAMVRNGRQHDGLTPERLEALVAGDR